MLWVYLAAFVIGLSLGVYAMLHGVERHDPAAPKADAFGRERAADRVVVALPVVAGGLAAGGIVGYVLTRTTALSPLVVFISVLLTAAAGGWGSAWLVSRWAVPGARREPEDPRYVLQGYPGRVVRSIDAAGMGEVVYEANDRRVVAPARSLDGSAILAGSEVIIDRVEDDVVYVELWSHVEQRI